MGGWWKREDGWEGELRMDGRMDGGGRMEREVNGRWMGKGAGSVSFWPGTPELHTHTELN